MPYTNELVVYESFVGWHMLDLLYAGIPAQLCEKEG